MVLSLNRRQAIIWTNVGQVYWCIYPSLGLSELIRLWEMRDVMDQCLPWQVQALVNMNYDVAGHWPSVWVWSLSVHRWQTPGRLSQVSHVVWYNQWQEILYRFAQSGFSYQIYQTQISIIYNSYQVTYSLVLKQMRVSFLVQHMLNICLCSCCKVCHTILKINI